MDRAFMDEYYDKMRADDIEELSSQRNEDYSDRADDYKAAKQALLEGLGLSHLFSGNRKLTPEEKELWLLFDRVYVTELLARDEFAKGAYMLGAEDRETMLREILYLLRQERLHTIIRPEKFYGISDNSG